MELYHLKTFVAVAEQSHLTRAARQLNTSQPAVSAHIKALEKELDIQLFTRTPKGMSLTQAGIRLKALALKTLESVNQIEAQAKVIKNELSGVVRVGLHVDPEFLRLERLFSICRSDFPGIEFHLSQNMSWEALEAVESRELDCAFMYGEPDSNRVGVLHLKKIPVKLAMPPAWKKRPKPHPGKISVPCPGSQPHRSAPFTKFPRIFLTPTALSRCALPWQMKRAF